MTFRVRLARADDGPRLQAIERLAAQQFRDIGLDSVADDEPLPVETLAAYALDGRGWVATDELDAPIAYAIVDVIDGCAHLEQISVHPDVQGLGIGRALVDQLSAWAQETSRPAVTLTTFTEVSWNQPLYEHLGFRVLADDQIGPELAALREFEANHGLDPRTRVAMRLDIPSSSQ